ncbi:MAG: tetratricopeptide repeat protein, partial [Methanothrix sp.]|nr:tetratricopeptide repeat protein [Methanothrix sp.]
MSGINMPEDENAKAEILYAQGDYEGAILAWEKAERVRPQSYAHWYKKGIALRKLDRYDEAATALENALLLDSKNADAWRAHALVCSQMDRNAEAIASCEKALALDSY